MFKLTLVGLLAHKVRYALTTVAVMLGVAFMAGTLVLTDTVSRTFDGLFADVYKSTSAVVRATQDYTPQLAFTSQRAQIDASLADKIREVPGVAEVRVGIAGYAQLVGRNGKPIGNPGTGAPTLGQAWNDVTAMNPFRMQPGGRPPRNPDEIVIDKHSADVGHLRIGERVTVLTKLAPAQYTITGVVRWETADSPLGASITLFTQATAERVLGQPGKADEIAVSAEHGISQQAMVDRLRAALADPSLEVVTGAQITAENQTSVHRALSFFNTFLLVFALIALFVGSFLIFNTFSIVVAQRLRELALLRAVGASRSQVARSVLGEALAVGLFASGLGLIVGIGLAIGLRAMLGALGMDIPSTGLVITARTIIVSLVVGVVITLVASIPPARRAATVAPIEALLDATGAVPRSPWRRVLAGALVLAAGLATLLTGLFGHLSQGIALVGAGAACLFVGLAMLGPLVARPAARTVGSMFLWLRPSGRLARSNAARNPRRTSATSAALMVGVAVVALMSVIASSMKASVASVVDSAMRADFVVNSGAQPGASAGFSPNLQVQLSQLAAVQTSTGVRAGAAWIEGSAATVLAADPRHISDLFDVGVSSGRIETMTATGIAISTEIASKKHLHLGQQVSVVFPTTGLKHLMVQAIYRGRDLAGDYVVPLRVAEQNFPVQLDFQVYVKLAPGVTASQGRSALETVLASYPTAKLLDREQYKQAQLAQINQLLNLVYALLALALLIAVVGIANTLSLSIHERTRELGLLRAVGMTRRQLRATVGLESVIVSLLGAVEGLVVGVLLGWAMVAALHSEGVTTLAIPFTTLIVIAVLAGLAGVLAAVGPARKAAKLDILSAIATE